MTKIRYVRLTRRQPAISVDTLALMLQIDLQLGRPADFRRRLQRALNNACKQGIANG